MQDDQLPDKVVGEAARLAAEAGPWHAVAVGVALARLGASPAGLDDAEAARRLARHGPNRLPAAKPRGPLRRLSERFDNLLIHVLLASAAITAAPGPVPRQP